MTTRNKLNGQTANEELITALYCRLSVEDMKDEKGNKKSKEDESNSIANQKQILLDYCKKHGYTNTMFFVDDGISGTSFERSDFQRMQRMAEEGKISRFCEMPRSSIPLYACEKNKRYATERIQKASAVGGTRQTKNCGNRQADEKGV